MIIPARPSFRACSMRICPLPCPARRGLSARGVRATSTKPPSPAPARARAPRPHRSRVTTRTTARANTPPVQPRFDPRRAAAPRGASPLREPPVHRVRPRLRAGDVAASVQGARHRVVVRPQVPRREDVDRRDLRHVCDDRRASDAAAAVVCAGDQRRDRQERRRARQRSRPVPARSRDRPLVRGRLPDRHRAEGQRRGRGRGDHSRRDRDRGDGAAAAGRVGACRGAAAGPAAGRCGHAGAGRAVRRRLRGAAGRLLRTMRTRRISSRTSRTNSRRWGSKRRSGR